MKNKFLLFLGVFFALGLLSGGCADRGYVIDGRIDGDVDGMTVYLYSGIGPFFYDEDVVDSTVIRKGGFEFRGEVPHPDIYTLKFFPDDSREMIGNSSYIYRPVIPIMLDRGRVTVRAQFDSIPMDKIHFDLYYDYSNIELTGPPYLTLFKEYVDGKSGFIDAENDYMRESRDIYYSEEMQDRIKYAVVTDVLKSKTKSYVIGFIEKNADNTVGLLAFRDYLGEMTADEIERLTAMFTPEMKTGPLGEEIMAKAAETAKSAVGAMFADFTLQDAEGNDVRLSDHLGRGNYVLLDFWSSGCGPCLWEIPHLKEVYELYHPDGFGIIGISMDTYRPMWEQILQEADMPWPQLSDLKGFEGGISEAYNFLALPACILVGPDGRIVHRSFKGPQLDMGVAQIYGDKFGDGESH